MTLVQLYDCFLACGAVTTDSRRCPKGSLFIALKGESFDGNTFAAKALEAGCAYALIDDAKLAIPGDNRYLLTDDCLRTLQQLANHHRRQLGTPIVGITGTNGKTTTKELVAAVLKQKFVLHFTQGNLNNHIGVPLTLLGLRPEHEVAVVEMGANHPGEIAELCAIAEPDCGLITNVGKAHLEGFGSFEGVKKTKGELYDFLRQRPEGLVFLHRNNEHLCAMSQGLKTFTYGVDEGCNLVGRLTDTQSPYLCFDWQTAGTAALHTVHTQLVGDYNLPNALAAVAVGLHFGVSTESIDHALQTYTPGNNRSQLSQTEHNTLIIDAYNANPTSMRAALENFERMDAPRKMVILGDMKELGKDSRNEHLHIVDLLKSTSIERICLVGNEFSAVGGKYDCFADVNALIEEFKDAKPEGYTILIKGSNSTHLIQIVEHL